MKKEKASVKVVPCTRRNKRSGTFPLKPGITCKGTRRYYGVDYDATRMSGKLLTAGRMSCPVSIAIISLNRCP